MKNLSEMVKSLERKGVEFKNIGGKDFLIVPDNPRFGIKLLGYMDYFKKQPSITVITSSQEGLYVKKSE